MLSNTNVHGSIFFLLRKFVIASYSEDAWKQFLVEAGKDADFEFVLTESYDIADINALVGAASAYSSHSVHFLQEAFGAWLVPDLFQFYGSYLQPGWKTWEVLVNTEKVMHGAVRRLNSTANPPALHVSEIIGNKLIIDYFSPRKMGSLAVGIIRGIAKYYNEEDDVDIHAASDPDAERVQIHVNFRNRK